MSSETNKLQQKAADKLEADKLQEVVVYTIEAGSYNKWSTTDKEQAFKVWQMITESFFELQDLGSAYSGPKFTWKKPVQVKLIGERKKVWVDFESAQRAHNAFEALKPNKDTEEEMPTPF